MQFWDPDMDALVQRWDARDLQPAPRPIRDDPPAGSVTLLIVLLLAGGIWRAARLCRRIVFFS